jgi:hypothetical protein
MKRQGALQLLAYLCPALVLWTHAGSANVQHMIPIFLALSYELACTRRSLALGDNGLILNTMRVAEKTYPSILTQMENADASLETVKQNLKLKKNAEQTRKRAIRNPCTVPDCKKKGDLRVPLRRGGQMRGSPRRPQEAIPRLHVRKGSAELQLPRRDIRRLLRQLQEKRHGEHRQQTLRLQHMPAVLQLPRRRHAHVLH